MRAKPIRRKEVRKDLAELSLVDLHGITLLKLNDMVQDLIRQHGYHAIVEPDGEPYEGYDHLKVYSVSMETEEEYQDRRKKILKARKALRTKQLNKEKQLAELRERSRQAALTHPQLKELV